MQTTWIDSFEIEISGGTVCCTAHSGDEAGHYRMARSDMRRCLEAAIRVMDEADCEDEARVIEMRLREH